MDSQPETAQSPSSSSCVLSDEDLRRLGATDTPSLLKLIPGLAFMRANLTDSHLSVRGIGRTVAEKPRVLVDGLRVSNAEGTIDWQLFPVTLSDVRRIEILNGLPSDSSGSHLMDGVINFITGHSDEMATGAAPPGGKRDDFESSLSGDHWRIPLLTIDGTNGVSLRSRSRVGRPKCPQ